MGKDQGKDGVVVDFEQERTKRLNEKQRKYERVFFKQLMSVYSVLDGSKMKPIDLVDVSEEGLGFQVPFDSKNPWPQDLKEMQIRLYLSQDTYLPLVIRIQNSRQAIEDGTRYLRYGCAVDQGTASYPVFQQFVRFLKLYSEQAHKDMGEVSLFYV